LDSSSSYSEENNKLYSQIKNLKNIYIVANKNDLETKLEIPRDISLKSISISAKNGNGISDLKKILYDDFCSTDQNIDLDLICNIRQIDALKEVRGHLQHMKTNLNDGFEDDVLTIDLKNAILKLGELTGDEVSEEVIDGIFSRFCVGK